MESLNNETITLKDFLQQFETTADIYEIRNIKSTGVFYYEKDRLINDFGSRIIEDFSVIKGITGHDAILRIFLKNNKLYKDFQ